MHLPHALTTFKQSRADDSCATQTRQTPKHRAIADAAAHFIYLQLSLCVTMATGTVVKSPSEMERWKVERRRPPLPAVVSELPLQEGDVTPSLSTHSHHSRYKCTPHSTSDYFYVTPVNIYINVYEVIGAAVGYSGIQRVRDARKRQSDEELSLPTFS